MNDITNNDADGSPRTAAAQKRARDAAAIGLTEDASPEKQQNVAALVAEELICPITHELLIEPVTTEDGKVYERAAIELWFETREGDPTSPMTNTVIGTQLTPAPQIRNRIEALVESGAIEGEIAETWKRKLAAEKRVRKLLAKAEGGDGEAMYRLGVRYKLGINGLAKDDLQARAWFKRSAAARYPRGIACFGECLLMGLGGPKNIQQGLLHVTAAAELGSDRGAFLLGRASLRGRYGRPKDRDRARFWLIEVVCGECEFKHLTQHDIAQAAKMLGEAMA